MNNFDMFRFEGFVAGVVAEGILVMIVSVAIILIRYAKMRRNR